MTHRVSNATVIVGLLLGTATCCLGGDAARLPAGTVNLLPRAKFSGNLESFDKGLRGQPAHMVYDVERGAFLEASQYHEYGVGFQQNLGVVPEAEAAFWMAEWPAPVEVNLMALSGTYPNQPQPDTAWKIEVRRDGRWVEHVRGVGGWYDRGLYQWGGAAVEPLRFDAFRVSLFSKDDKTPIESIHFRGEAGVSWIVGQTSTVDVRIAPLTGSVMAGHPMTMKSHAAAGSPTGFRWRFGDGNTAEGADVRYAYPKPGIYQVTVEASDGRHAATSRAIVRVHTPETLHVPQVLLDTDQKNEQDDQHYFGYALFSELDVLGVNSVHHGGGQEPVNYAEILHVLDLARKSGLPAHREPAVYRGANRRLAVPPTGKWDDTVPIVTDASEAILAAARGASPQNPVWIVPVGPGTNVASAILQAKADGLALRDRIRIIWLGGSNTAVTGEFNGNNDPWSMYVIAQSGIETWFIPAPVGARVSMDKRTEGHLYADHPLGRYLKSIMPDRNKALYDASALSAIISERLALGWVKEVEPVAVGGPDQGYRWTKSDRAGAVRVIRQIDQKAMQHDLFHSMQGKPTRLIGVPPAG